jgi:hypothetical protein
MSILKLTLGVISNVAIFGVFLFLPAGTLDWWRAWMLLGLMFVGAVASTATLLRTNEAVLEARFESPVQEGQPVADEPATPHYEFPPETPTLPLKMRRRAPRRATGLRACGCHFGCQDHSPYSPQENNSRAWMPNRSPISSPAGSPVTRPSRSVGPSEKIPRPTMAAARTPAKVPVHSEQSSAQ